MELIIIFKSKKNFELDKEIPYHKLFIPTNESIRNDFFMDFGVKNKIHYMFCGPTGTGKTVTIKNQLNSKYLN